MAGNEIEIRVAVRGAAAAAASLGRLSVGAAIIGWAPAAAAALTQLAGAALLIPGAVSMAAAVLATFKVATSGVGEALSAMSTEAVAGGAATQSSGRAIRDALDAVSDARRRAAQVAEDTARDIARAERDLARTIRDGARDVADAKRAQEKVARDVARSIEQAERSAARTAEQSARQVEQATERVEDALERERDAQEALTDAREDATRALEDLREKVSDYALDEEGLILRLRQAEAAQRRQRRDAKATALDRQQAAHDVRVAEERLSDLQRERVQDTAALVEAEAKGINGSAQVVRAQEQVADAHEAVIDAQEAQAQTARDVAQANADAAQRVADAVRDGAERQAEAAQRVADAERSAAEQRQAAEEALADARRNAARQNEEAAEAVADAEQRLADAREDAARQAAASTAGTNAYAEALAKLSPNARAFVEQIKALRPEWEAMQRSVQDKFFAGFAQEVRELAGKYIPVLKDGMGGVAEAMNRMAIYASDALLDPKVVGAVATIFENTALFIDNARTSLGDFLSGFLQLGAIGSEYLPVIGTWLADIAARFREWVETSPQGVREFIDNALTGFRDLWGILTNVWDTISLVLQGLGGGEGGEGFLALMKSLSQTIRDIAGNAVVQTILAAVGTAMRAIVETAPLWAPVAVGIWLVNAALAANPATLVVIAIVAVIAAIKLLWDNWDRVSKAIAAAWDWLWGKIRQFGSWLAGWGGTAWNALVSGWNWVRDTISRGWDWLISKLAQGRQWISEKLAGMWNGLTGGAKSAINGALYLVNRMIDGINMAIWGLNRINPFGQIGYIRHVSYLARGGIASGMAVVGEQGPELVRLGPGSRVHSAGDSQRMLTQMAGQQQQQGAGRFELVVRAGAADAVATMIMELQRTGKLQLRAV